MVFRMSARSAALISFLRINRDRISLALMRFCRGQPALRPTGDKILFLARSQRHSFVFAAKWAAGSLAGHGFVGRDGCGDEISEIGNPKIGNPKIGNPKIGNPPIAGLGRARCNRWAAFSLLTLLLSGGLTDIPRDRGKSCAGMKVLSQRQNSVGDYELRLV
jgi:hypothetical protein